MTTPLAQNPDELFDIVTSEGEPTGKTKRRADVHRDGDWHRSLHIWVYGVDDAGPFVLMQQRGMDKDTNPGMIDPAVSGHLGAGETVQDGFREMEEEIGIPVVPDRMQHIGTRPRAAEHTTPGVIDRELQEVYLYRDDRSLDTYRPNRAEVDALISMRLDDAIALFAGEITEAPGTFLDAHNLTMARGVVDTTMFSPRQVDRYYLRAVVAIDRALRGERYVIV